MNINLYETKDINIREEDNILLTLYKDYTMGPSIFIFMLVRGAHSISL